MESTDVYLKPFNTAAASIGLEALAVPVNDETELESVIAAVAREPNGTLIAMPNTFMDDHRVEITSLAVRYKLPSVYPYPFFPEVGGLVSYGVDVTDNF